LAFFPAVPANVSAVRDLERSGVHGTVEIQIEDLRNFCETIWGVFQMFRFQNDKFSNYFSPVNYLVMFSIFRGLRRFKFKKTSISKEAPISEIRSGVHG
jgi:hypothetical protein